MTVNLASTFATIRINHGDDITRNLFLKHEEMIQNRYTNVDLLVTTLSMNLQNHLGMLLASSSERYHNINACKESQKVTATVIEEIKAYLQQYYETIEPYLNTQRTKIIGSLSKDLREHYDSIRDMNIKLDFNVMASRFSDYLLRGDIHTLDQIFRVLVVDNVFQRHQNQMLFLNSN